MNASRPAISQLKPQAEDLPVAACVMADGVSITCYENHVPAFVEAELERIYSSIFSSLLHFRVYGGLDNASTYVERKDDEITGIFLFRREGRHVRVVNEWIRVGEEEVARFAAYIFKTQKGVSAVSFHAVDADIGKLPFPFQRFCCTDDSVLSLPDTADAYLAQLGKATRKNIRRYQSRLKENYPSFRYQVYETTEVDEQHVRDIIRLNRIRMANKNKVSGLDDAEVERMLKMIRARGFVGVATIDGKLCAGAITYRFGKNYFSMVRTHDPKYDDDRLGLVCGYLIISECIARGGKEFHFLWGREEHKSILLGAEKDLHHLTVYRTPMHCLLNARLACGNAYAAGMVQARLRLKEMPRDGLAWRAASSLRRLMHWARNVGRGQTG